MTLTKSDYENFIFQYERGMYGPDMKMGMAFVTYFMSVVGFNHALYYELNDNTSAKMIKDKYFPDVEIKKKVGLAR